MSLKNRKRRLCRLEQSGAQVSSPSSIVQKQLIDESVEDIGTSEERSWQNLVDWLRGSIGRVRDLAIHGWVSGLIGC